MVADDGSITGTALQQAGPLQGAVGVAIAQALDPGPDAIGVLQQEPQEELQALLKVLEPPPPSTLMEGEPQPRLACLDRAVEPSQQAVLARSCAHQFFATGDGAPGFLLQPRRGRQEALLLIRNQVDAKTGGELMISSVEGCKSGT